MRIPTEHHAVQLATDQVFEILSTIGYVAEPSFEVHTRTAGSARGWDAVLNAGGHTFVMEWKGSGAHSRIAMSVQQLADAPSHFPEGATPLLAVPYMGEAGRNYCEQNGVSWLDLSGNARIVAPGIFYQDLGHPNRFRRPGRPESAFGPRGSRIARQLLMNPEAQVRQRSLADVTGLNEGHVSRIIGKLVDTGLVERADEGIRVVDADLLLDAWREEYRFDRHTVIPGHVAARSGIELVHSLAGKLSEFEVPYAVTGLAAAWLWTKHAGFRISTMYLSGFPSTALLSDLGFRDAPRGANTWLVVPNDQGVFHGSSQLEGIRCIHPVQVYLDLAGHPERSQEAADELRSRLLMGRDDER